MSEPVETQPARLVWHPDTDTVTVEIVIDGASVVVATISAE